MQCVNMIELVTSLGLDSRHCISLFQGIWKYSFCVSTHSMASAFDAFS